MWLYEANFSMYLLYSSYIKIATTKKEGTDLLQPVPQRNIVKF